MAFEFYNPIINTSSFPFVSFYIKGDEVLLIIATPTPQLHYWNYAATGILGRYFSTSS